MLNTKKGEGKKESDKTSSFSPATGVHMHTTHITHKLLMLVLLSAEDVDSMQSLSEHFLCSHMNILPCNAPDRLSCHYLIQLAR